MIFVYAGVVGALCTFFAAILTDLSVGELVAVYYLTAGIAGIVPQLTWPRLMPGLKARIQAMRER